MAIWVPSRLLDLHRWLPCSPPSASTTAIAAGVAVQLRSKHTERPRLVSASCSSLQRDQETQQQQEYEEEDLGIMCEPCNGRGWLLCDFCKGQKNNIKAENNRIYRRCPTCKAVGYVLCSKCKVFKCVTFPDYSDGDLSTT